MQNYKPWKEWTIATKIGVVITIGVITSILVIAIGGISFLKKEFLTTIGRHHFATVQAYAMYVDAEMSNRLNSIKAAAESISPGTLFDPSEAQEFFSTREKLVSLFDDGLMILSTEGILLAEEPFLAKERQGADFSTYPFYQQVKKSASPLISEPFISSKPSQRPVIEFMAPIYNAQGEIVGYLCGGLSLNGDNVLGNFAKRKVGDKGYFYIYSQDRTILVHQDSSRVMKRDVPPGANRLFDLALKGFDGSEETINSSGLHLLAAFQHLQSAPWILAANLPMKEVLAPFNSTRKLVIVTITLCGLAVILVSVWSLFRFMTPLNRFIAHMQECGEEGSSFEYKGGPEVSRLATIFNQMLARIKRNEEHLRKLSQAVEQCPVSIIITDSKGNIEFVNPAFSQLTGYTFAEALGQNPRIFKTDKTHHEVYEQLWQTISSGKVWEGEFYNQKKNGEPFIEHATIAPVFNKHGQITHYLAVKDDITIRKQSEEIIWQQANFDSLTKLPNRRLFLYRLQNAIPFTKRENAPLVLMFLDLDHFKEVNDTLGHDYGDLLLIEAAKRIRECVRDTDTVSRFGGDEFVLLLTNIKLDTGIQKVASKILAALNQPFYLKNEVATVSASIGATICPQDGDDVITLLKNADLTMYLAKDSGRNSWKLFNEVLVKDSQEKSS